MTNGLSRQANVKGFGFDFFTFKQAINMFERI